MQSTIHIAQDILKSIFFLQFAQCFYQTSSFQGGSSIQNKSQRTLYVPNDTPSPTAYNPQKITKKQPHVSHLPPPGKGKLYVCRPPRFSNTAPSIPTRIDENGYYIDEYGNLQKNSPDEYDTTLGPAFYHVNTVSYYEMKLHFICHVTFLTIALTFV